MKLLLAIFLLLPQSPPFTKFSYCVEKSRGPYESQCLELNAEGKGQVRLKKRAQDELKLDVALSAAARDRFLSIIGATNNLEGGDSYESGRKVADLGKKRVSLQLSSGAPRQAEFNYSLKKEVNDLVGFVEGVFNEETIVLEVENAIHYDRLAIPKQLERIEAELKSSRIADPERLIPLLDKIQSDARLINYARARAGKLKEEIVSKKPL
jgi:hypothetical protein